MMRKSRFRFTMLGLMGVVALAALGSVGLREWEMRQGRGAPYWQQARRFEALARRDIAKAREYRECPRDHTPWKVRFQCPGCIACPSTPSYTRRGVPPTYVPDFAPESERGRILSKQYIEQHEAVAREYEAEAALSRKLRDRYLRAASRPPDGEFTVSPAEQRLIFGDTLDEKYRYDSY